MFQNKIGQRSSQHQKNISNLRPTVGFQQRPPVAAIAICDKDKGLDMPKAFWFHNKTELTSCLVKSHRPCLFVQLSRVTSHCTILNRGQSASKLSWKEAQCQVSGLFCDFEFWLLTGCGKQIIKSRLVARDRAKVTRVLSTRDEWWMPPAKHELNEIGDFLAEKLLKSNHSDQSRRLQDQL